MTATTAPPTPKTRRRTTSLRSRFTTTITLITVAAVGAIAYFAYTRATETQILLGNRLQDAVRAKAEAQLQSLVRAEAANADRTFQTIAHDVVRLSNYASTLLNQETALADGSYWDARTQLSRTADGQYDNPDTDLASIVISSHVELTDAMAAELNSLMLLDFIAPAVLQSSPDIAGMYFIGLQGQSVYYPNIDLASIVPPDFRPEEQIFFTVADPTNNPSRANQWTAPYQDPAGVGLIITASAPVYDQRDRFRGVLAADILLLRLSDRLNALRIGQSGYAVLMDSAGRILAMPDAGYDEMFITREVVPVNEVPNQTLLSLAPQDLRPVVRLMSLGASSLTQATFNGVDHYVAYAPIPTTSYSLAIIVPVNELIQEYISTNAIVTQEAQTTVQIGILIIALVLLAAVLASIGFSRLFTAPLDELTSVAEQVTAGNLNATARVAARDEIGQLAEAFNLMTAQVRGFVTSLEQSVRERTRTVERRTAQVSAGAEIARAASTELHPEVLMLRVVELIQDRFSLYYVGIFLVDETNRFAVLHAGTGEAGKILMGRGHRLEIGGQSMIGRAVSERQARIALDVGQEAVRFSNPVLPNTRSEMALPLVARDRVIGALTIQSDQPEAFSEEDILSLQGMADLIAVALDNARLFREAQQALQEVSGLHRSYLSQAWETFARNRVVGEGNLPTYSYTSQAFTRGEAVSLPQVEQAIEASRPVVAAEGDTSTVTVPITLREQVIGAIAIESDSANRSWSQEDLTLIQAVLEQTALSLENARLIEETETALAESRRLAGRERTVNTISSKIRRLPSVESVLTTALVELSRTLGANKGAVRLGAAPRRGPVSEAHEASNE